MSLRASAAALLSVSLAFAACGEKAPPPPPAPEPTPAAAPTAQDPATLTYAPVTGVDLSKMTKDSAGYYWQDLTVGKGATAEPGKTLSMDYTGWLADGTEFDSSKGKQPYDYVLGGRTVIPAWDIAPAGMKVGGKRLIVVPSTLGYGMAGNGPDIKPGDALVFILELKAVK